MAVYFIQSGGPDGPIKIGYTNGSVLRRLQMLQTGNPNTLVVLASVPGSHLEERRLHAKFWSTVVGGEWYAASDALLDHIKSEITQHRTMFCRYQRHVYRFR